MVTIQQTLCIIVIVDVLCKLFNCTCAMWWYHKMYAMVTCVCSLTVSYVELQETQLQHVDLHTSVFAGCPVP